MGQQGWASDASPVPTLSMRDALASGGLTRHWNSLVRLRRLYAYRFKEIALQKRTPRPAAQHGRRLAGAGCTPGPAQQLVTRLNVTYLEFTPRSLSDERRRRSGQQASASGRRSYLTHCSTSLRRSKSVASIVILISALRLLGGQEADSMATLML